MFQDSRFAVVWILFGITFFLLSSLVSMFASHGCGLLVCTFAYCGFLVPFFLDFECFFETRVLYNLLRVRLGSV